MEDQPSKSTSNSLPLKSSQEMIPEEKKFRMKTTIEENPCRAGMIFHINTLAFYREPPIELSITFGYDRPTNNYFLYMETSWKADMPYSSPAALDSCFYNSLMDENLREPVLVYYLKILKKYKILIPIDTYIAFGDLKYCHPEGKTGYDGRVRFPFNCFQQNYKVDFDKYYLQFENVVYGLDYVDPENFISQIKKNPLPPSNEKNRLMLGEANFTYSAAFIKKHENHANLPKKIIATEYDPEDKMKNVHGKTFLDSISYLQSKGVEIRFGIDGTKIDTTFSGKKFKYIHFNCPHDRSDYKTRTLPKLLKEFFESASKAQEIGDKIYMALPTPTDKDTREKRESYIYKVYDAAAEAGYKLIKKRKFDNGRYSGYTHAITGKKKSAPVAANSREYIFQKIEPNLDLPQTIHYKSPSELREYYSGEQHYDKGHILPDNINTDSDSSEISDEVNQYEKFPISIRDDDSSNDEYEMEEQREEDEKSLTQPEKIFPDLFKQSSSNTNLDSKKEVHTAEKYTTINSEHDPVSNNYENLNTQQVEEKLLQLTNFEWRKYPNDKLSGRYVGHQIRFFNFQSNEIEKAKKLQEDLKSKGFDVENRIIKKPGQLDRPSLIVDLNSTKLPKPGGK